MKKQELKQLDEFPVNPYQELANEIILQAVRDYRKALKHILKNESDEIAIARKKECERFFISTWFNVLTDLDGKTIMNKLKAELNFKG